VGRARSREVLDVVARWHSSVLRQDSRCWSCDRSRPQGGICGSLVTLPRKSP
jgi:hypothetical protein